jgi:hypothetical protein
VHSEYEPGKKSETEYRAVERLSPQLRYEKTMPVMGHTNIIVSAITAGYQITLAPRDIGRLAAYEYHVGSTRVAPLC